jgi:hypothetical protein
LPPWSSQDLFEHTPWPCVLSNLSDDVAGPCLTSGPRLTCIPLDHISCPCLIGAVQLQNASRPCLLSMPRRRRSALECLTISTGIDGSAVRSLEREFNRNHAHPIQTRLKGLRRPPTDHCTTLDTRLISHADKKPATPSNMDAQRQTTKKSSSKQVPKTSAPRSVSRSSSMQVEDGREASITETSSKSQGKGNCDSSYSMDRWLSQKPSEEPWHGSGR